MMITLAGAMSTAEWNQLSPKWSAR
jgi:hypothetical protein